MPKKTDSNQKRIVAALRKMGCSVAVLSDVGKGFPDILVGINGKNILMEIKDGEKPPSQRKLTPGEIAFHDKWRGQVVVVESVDQIIEIINKY